MLENHDHDKESAGSGEPGSQHPDSESQGPAGAPFNNYWVSQEQRRVQNTPPQPPQNTTPPSYNQGYPPYTPPSTYTPYNPNQNQNYNGGYNPYQYNPNSGWQQSRQPEQRYEWNFEDYDKLAVTKEKKKKNRGLVVFAVSILCVLAVGLVGLSGYSIWSNMMNGDTISDGTKSLPIGDESTSSSVGQLQIAGKPEINESVPVGGKMTIPQVAAAVSPSVVGVIQSQNATRYYETTGMGSGIIMSEDGYIITNAHVVEGGVAFKVELHDGTPYEAKLVGADPMTDLAVLKIEATGLTAAKFGNSDELQVGETVIAIGNPAGNILAGSVTQGIISALNREVQTTNYSMTYIQTDAAINPGNSGGALVNEYGQVIGINSSKIVAEGYEGIGFAIPMSTAKPVIDDILSNGRVTGRVMLGVSCIPIDEVDARNYDIKMGLEIKEITSPEMADKDIMVGDIITHINGERVYDLSSVREILNNFKAGDSVTLTLYRKISYTKDTEFDVSIKLIEDQG